MGHGAPGGGGMMGPFGHLNPTFRETANEAFYRMATPKLAQAEAGAPVSASCREHPVPYPGCPNCPVADAQAT